MAGSRAIPIRDIFAQACLIEIVPAVINPDLAMVGMQPSLVLKKYEKANVVSPERKGRLYLTQSLKVVVDWK